MAKELKDEEAVATEGVAPAVEAPEQKKAKKKVEVDADMLESVVSRLENLEASNAAKDKEIERLTSAADIGRLQQYDMKHGGKLIRKGKVVIYRDTLVNGWKMVKDEVRIRNNQVIADQVIQLYGLDKDDKLVEHEPIDYLDFVRGIKTVEGDIVKKATDEESDRTLYTLKFADGREIEIDIRFINAF